jgi:hypothetical protein
MLLYGKRSRERLTDRPSWADFYKEGTTSSSAVRYNDHHARSLRPGKSVANPRSVLQLFEFHPSILHKLARASALLRYLIINLKADEVSTNLKGLVVGSPTRFAGNTPSDTNSIRIKNSLAASMRFSAI